MKSPNYICNNKVHLRDQTKMPVNTGKKLNHLKPYAMFGIEKISWTQFSLFLLYVTAAWYAGLFAWAWIKGKKSKRKTLFEYDDLDELPKEVLLPLSVSASDFPKEMIPNTKPEDVELITNLYEDSGIDDGYLMEQFTEKDLSRSPELLKKIRIQQ